MALCSSHRTPSLISKPMFCCCGCSSFVFAATPPLSPAFALSPSALGIPLPPTPPPPTPALVLCGCGAWEDELSLASLSLPNRMPVESGCIDAWDATRLDSGEVAELEEEFSPNEGTISLMTEVIGLSAAKLDVRSPAPVL